MRLIVFLILCLSLPMVLILDRNGAVMPYHEAALGALGIALVIFTISGLLKKQSMHLAALFSAILVLVALIIRFSLGFLYDFAGRGFTSEFFAHINPTALHVALEEYGKEGLILAIAFPLLSYFAYRYTLKDKPPRTPMLILSFLLGSTSLYFGTSGTPELLLTDAYGRYNQENTIQAHQSKLQNRESAAKILAPIGIQIPTEKVDLTAKLPALPVNLIFVYLESFNQVFTDDKLFPRLTPQIAKLRQRYITLDQVYTSSYVTIEGIANSQCGTLVNMDYANDSMTTAKGRLSLLTCLGDVLDNTGYTQTFLGGASLKFAGKGLFLKEHGYSQTLGKAHWDKLGYEPVGIWGFSDVELYKNALKSIKKKRQQNTPYNLNLLTLGTHRPGFHYQGCPTYPNPPKNTDQSGKKLLNAVHCADHLLGEFVSELEKQGVLENTVLFIQGDHGVFPTPDMLRLIGKEAYYPKVFTLVATPNLDHQKKLYAAKDTPSSNVDSVATILELLNIEHNAKFVLARSQLNRTALRPYLLSRRSDFYQNTTITNTHKGCHSIDTPTIITLPLNDCGKKAVMSSLSALNNSYTLTADANNNVCSLAVKVVQDPKNKHLHINWGNHNLTKQFYYRGSKKNKHMLKGIYLIVADGTNAVLQTQFYAADKLPEMKLLNKLLDEAAVGKQIVLLSDVNFTDLPSEMAALWPALLRGNKLVYGSMQTTGFSVHHQQGALKETNAFKPISCKS